MIHDVGEIVSLLTRGIHDASVYFASHPRVAQAAESASQRLETVLAASGKDRLFLRVSHRSLVFEGRHLLGATLIAKRLIDATERLKSGGVVLRRGATAADFTAFFGVCSTLRANSLGLDDARSLLRSQGVNSVELPAPGDSSDWRDGRRLGLDDDVAVESIRSLGRAIAGYQQLIETVETAHASAESGGAVDVDGGRSTVGALLSSLKEEPATILSLARYPDYDSYTVGHSVRVALFTLLVGTRLTSDEGVLIEMGTAGLLHDVGKSRVPHEILFKRGPLDVEERRQMAAHPVVGAKILLEQRNSSALGVAAAFSHHLRHDGKGYPPVRPWARRGRVTALVQVCDVFEALTAIRPYKPALTPARAYEIMLADREAFDPAAFAAFVAAVGLYPPGSRVRLTTGQHAIVLRPGRDVARPVVEVTDDSATVAPVHGGGRILDLSAQAPGEELEVEDIVLDDVAPARDRIDVKELAAEVIPSCCSHEQGPIARVDAGSGPAPA